MPKVLYILILILMPVFLSAQFKGGRADGFSHTMKDSETMFSQNEYCEGGSDDGFSFETLESNPLFSQELYCEGGDGDGFDFLSLASLPINQQFGYSQGGSGDGFAFLLEQTPLNEQDAYAQGGDFDGFASTNLSSQPMNNPAIYEGGDYDGMAYGFSGDTILGYGLWQGTYTSHWNWGVNWRHNYVPRKTTNVTIPAGCPNFPAVSDTLNINGLDAKRRANRIDILSGASLTSANPVLVNGILNIWGDLIITSSIDTSFKIGNGGIVTVDSAGNLLLGNQTVAPALSDMIIHDGGALYLNDGNINVDDQFVVGDGGRFEMTGGIFWAHKYGEGSDIWNDGNYSPFFVESGAIGNVTGGTLRVTGKSSGTSINGIQINEPAFFFGGDNTLSVRNGDSPNSYTCELGAAPGVALNRLIILRNKTLRINTDLHVKQELLIKKNTSALEIWYGKQVTVGE